MNKPVVPKARWEDGKKFWAETIRTIIFAILGFGLTLKIVKPFEQKTSYASEIDKERLVIKAKLIEAFAERSYRYTSTVSDAFAGDPQAIALYGGQVFDDYRNVRNIMSVFFGPEVKRLIKEGDIVNTNLRNMYKRGFNPAEWNPVREKLKEKNNEITRAAGKELGLIKD